MRVSATLQGIIDEECDITQKALPPAAAKIARGEEQKKGGGERRWVESGGGGELASRPDFPTSAVGLLVFSYVM